MRHAGLFVIAATRSRANRTQRALRADFWRRERRFQLRRLWNEALVTLAFIALVLAACLAITKWIPR